MLTEANNVQQQKMARGVNTTALRGERMEPKTSVDVGLHGQKLSRRCFRRHKNYSTLLISFYYIPQLHSPLRPRPCTTLTTKWRKYKLDSIHSERDLFFLARESWTGILCRRVRKCFFSVQQQIFMPFSCLRTQKLMNREGFICVTVHRSKV